VSAYLREGFEQEGIRVLTGHAAQEVRVDGTGKVLVCACGEETVEVPFDALLVAVGRKPGVAGFGLEELGVALSPRGTVDVDPFLRTNFPNIYAVGDVAGPYQFTHTASHQAWYAAVNALFGGFKSFRVDYTVIPWCTFTDPEVARVGLSEEEAKQEGMPVAVTRFEFADLDRAIADGETRGWIKVLTRPGSDRILGVTIVGSHAGDLLAEWVLAMKHGLGLNKLLGTIHTYPTLAESARLTAGVWKRAHAPSGLLRWAERYHAWRRN
jgi:pyruvate/2-oxoglutarate dehydrogenase complex dihydrolipoamide dehydrogenase (E3) component